MEKKELPKTVRICHLENPNITTFIDGQQIEIRNHEATVDIDIARRMMVGPFGYELKGVYDDFKKYTDEIEVIVDTYGKFEKQNDCVLLCTPMTAHKVYSWKKYSDALLNLEYKEKIRLVFVFDTLKNDDWHEFTEWTQRHTKEFNGVSIIYWDADLNMAWNRVFKITVARQLILNYAKTTEASHIWFVDSDNLLPTDALPKLLSHNRPATAGFYRFKSIEAGGPVVFNAQGTKITPFNCLGDQQVSVSENTGTYEVDWTGAGCLLISREVFTVFTFDWNSWIQRHGEDAYICLFAQRLTGKQVLLDTSVYTKHLDESGKEW